MNNKLGIMTYYAANNYGAALQAYALQQSVRSLGGSPVFLRFFDTHNEKATVSKRSPVAVFFNNKVVRNEILFHFKRFINSRKYSGAAIKAFSEFRNNYLITSCEPYYDLEDLKMANKHYCGFIAGSDMVWTPIGQNLEAYFLQFADPSKRFSFSPSLTGCKSFSNEVSSQIINYINGFREVSCREKEGVDFIMQNLGKKAAHTLDPTLLLSKQEWCMEFNIKSDCSHNPYLLCYNFGGLPQGMKKQVSMIAKKRGLDVCYVPMTLEERAHNASHGFPPVCGPKEFVELFFNASFIISNGFHGFLFSLISETPFVVIRREKGNAWKVNESRIEDLMLRLGLQDRYIELDQKIDDRFFGLDYSCIRPIIESEKHKSIEYLKRVIRAAIDNSGEEEGDEIITYSSNVKGVSYKDCTGCEMCASICPFNAIQMREDDEGFRIPFVNETLCKNCGICIKRCPSTLPPNLHYPQNTSLVLSKNGLVNNSASGGLFITVAKYFIESLKGIVFGAVLDKDLTCRHAEAKTINELLPMQNSKYIQSIIGDSYKKTKQYLLEGRYVLFSGTPCQIAGLKSFLSQDYDNLLTMDVVCHGVPSQFFWRLYLDNIGGSDIVSYTFRNRNNKKIGKQTQESTITKNTNVYHIPSLQDPFYCTFVRSESIRYSCYYCKYARKERVSDITMGDCDTDKLYPSFFPNESKSICLINTDKGSQYWMILKKYFDTTSLNYEEETHVNTCLRYPSIQPVARKAIYHDLKNLPWGDFVKKYTYHSHLKNKVLLLLNKLK